jgi:membrane protease YdiL (CAAX protease family)
VDGDSGAITQLCGALLLLAISAVVISSVVRGRTLPRRVVSRPDGRVWLYRNFLLRMWPLMVLPVVMVWASDRVSARDVGWAWPHGAIGYLLGAYYLLVSLVAATRIRRLMRRGQVIAQRQRVAFMVPRTRRERWWAVALAVTAGVTEETLFRGSLLAVGTKVYHLPAGPVVVAALVLFAVSHLYQGWRGVLGSALIGAVFTAIFVASGSLLPAIVTHAVYDLISLLLVPAEAAPQPPTAGQPPGDAQPGDARPGDAQPGDAQPGDAQPSGAGPHRGAAVSGRSRTAAP